MILEIILITLAPFLELRASIPYGILTGTHWLTVFVVAVITNIILGIIIFFLLHAVLDKVLKIPVLYKLYHKYVERLQTRSHKTIEKYGDWAIAIFIGVPLPGSGVYSGALLAYLLNIPTKKFMKANIIGAIIAGVLVTAIVLSGTEAFTFFLTKV